MLLRTILLLLARPDQPAPLDAYAANYARIKVDCEYSYTAGGLQGTSFDESMIWQGEGIVLVEDRRQYVDGRWSCDGEAERVLNRPDPKVMAQQLAAPRAAGPGRWIVQYPPPIEVLTDGRRVAYTTWPVDLVTLEFRGDTPHLAHAKAPLFRWQEADLRSMLRRDYPGVTPERGEAVRHGRPLRVEVYRAETKGGWRRTEIGYDPSVGHLPRFCRDIFSSREREAVSIHDRYLVDAVRCKTGGFVPMGWYAIVFEVPRPTVEAPAYSACMPLSPSKIRHVGHLKVTRFSDREARAALEVLGAVEAISDGSPRRYPQASFPPTLTLDRAEAMLGTSRASEESYKRAPRVAQDDIGRSPQGESRGYEDPHPYRTVALALAAIGALFAALVACYLARQRRSGWPG